MQELSKRIIHYDLAMRTFGVILSIIGFIICFYTIKSMYKAYKKEEDNFWFEEYYSGKMITFFGLVLTVVMFFILVFSTISFCVNFTNIIQDIFLPEKTIIEFIKPYLQ